jgi:hypothetical protein
MKNILDLDQVCEIANDVYFEVIDHLGLYDDMVQQTKNKKPDLMDSEEDKMEENGD